MSEELNLNFEDITLDFSDVRDLDEPLPAGIYGPAAVVDVKPTTSSNGNPMVNLRFRIQPEAPAAQGESFFGRLVFTSQTMQMVRRDLNRLGVDTTKQFTLSELPGKLMGKQCMLRIAITEWEGNRRNEIKEILPVDQGLHSAGDLF